jgi:hypothetical protein
MGGEIMKTLLGFFSGVMIFVLLLGLAVFSYDMIMFVVSIFMGDTPVIQGIGDGASL